MAIYKDMMSQRGFNEFIADIFSDWESVKDELLEPDKKEGSGNGTVHVYLKQASYDVLKSCFPIYFKKVETVEDTNDAPIIKHYFSTTNIISMFGFVCKFYLDQTHVNIYDFTKSFFDLISVYDRGGMIETESLIKLSLGSSQLRPYFKKFDPKGPFYSIIRKILVNGSSYKISLYKDKANNYAAVWMIGFPYMNDPEASLIINETSDPVISVKELSSDKRKEYFSLYLENFSLKSNGVLISSSTRNSYKGMLGRERITELVKKTFANKSSFFDIVNQEDIDKFKELDEYNEINTTQHYALSATVLQYCKYLDFYVKNDQLIPPTSIVKRPNHPRVDEQTVAKEQIPFNIGSIVARIKSTGLIYSDDLIKRFTYALMSKPFVILSGLAGSGKTQLALTFAKCMCEDIKHQICTVSVGADWTNREPLLGYPNALKTDEYVKPESGVLDLLLDARDNPNRPYFLILDEMNLSVVERYFSDFLSVMESKQPIKLWKGNEDEEDLSKYVPDEIKLPKNLYIIGTINVDETTYMFSPKVLDRANVIEFKIAQNEMESFLANCKPLNKEAADTQCASMSQDFIQKSSIVNEINLDSATIDTLKKFFEKLSEVNAEFGYRAVNEIYCYLYNVGDELGEYGAIDTAVLQKLLPKLHGSRKKLTPILSALWKLCYKNSDNATKIESIKDFTEVNDDPALIYKHSAEKIFRMYHAAIDNGFTSFAEA